MKPRYLAFSSLIAISTMAVAILGVAAENNAVTLNQGFAGNVTYNLDITSLNASNKTLNTSNGNPISFYVGSYDGGTFSANGYIKNKTAISGLESISVTGLSAGASFTVQYGWADNDWDVTDGVIDADHLTYDFGGESPSFFSISSSAAASVASIALSYS